MQGQPQMLQPDPEPTSVSPSARECPAQPLKHGSLSTTNRIQPLTAEMLLDWVSLPTQTDSVEAKRPAPLCVTLNAQAWPQTAQHLLTCESLPTPLTGLRSVWPSALTANTATSRASPTAAKGSMRGRPSMGVSRAVQKAPDTNKPPTHQPVGMRCSAESCSRSSSTSLWVLKKNEEE